MWFQPRFFVSRFLGYYLTFAFQFLRPAGEVSEWSKEHAWSEGLLWRKCVYFKRVPGIKVFSIVVYYSYLLKSLKDGRYYYGSTEDVTKRLIKHNSGQVKSTKGRRPFIIHFVEEHLNRSLAFQREMFYKSIEGYIYLKEKQII